jgi:O-antigen ligase
MLADRPIQGAGLGAYPTVIKPYHKATWMEIFQYPHNILLNLWSETGLLGILAFTWMCFTWFRLSKLRLPLLLPLIAILIHGLVDVPYFKNDLALAFFTFMVFVTLPKEKSI